MGKITADGGLIRLEQITDDEPLCQRLNAFHPGDTLTLEVGGFVGRWRRTIDAIEPVDLNMRQAWADMRAEPLSTLEIQLVTTDGSRLVTFGVAGQLWDDPASQYR